MILFPTFRCHIESAFQKIRSLCPQLCLLAYKMAPEGGRDADDQKSLKWSRVTDIETYVPKNEGCKFIGMTCNTCRKIIKDKKENILENGRKGAIKWSKIKISENKKMRFVLMSQGALKLKIRSLCQKHVICRCATHRDSKDGRQFIFIFFFKF